MVLAFAPVTQDGAFTPRGKPDNTNRPQGLRRLGLRERLLPGLQVVLVSR